MCVQGAYDCMSRVCTDEQRVLKFLLLDYNCALLRFLMKNSC